MQAEEKAKEQEEEQRIAEERAKLKAEKDQYQLGITERLAMAKFNSENARTGANGL